MPIPVAHQYRYVYHFTHITNLPNLLRTGFLCNNHPEFPAQECRSIAEPSIQVRRAEMQVPCGPGGTVHDYVPLYFGSLSPMLLAVIQKKNVDQMDILYFEFPISLLTRDGVVFTDASANTAVPPNFYSDPSDLVKLNWTEIDSLKWASANEDLRHQRMAEVLILEKLALTEASRVVVWNKTTKSEVERLVKEAGVQFPPIEFQSQYRRHWFTKFLEDPTQSLVLGPRAIALRYDSAWREVAQHQYPNNAAQFENLQALLESLRHDFGSLPQTAELIGLQSENVMHHETVSDHTQTVVQRLRDSREFKELPANYKDIVELAAFLHDIGKGPKARWVSNGGVQKVDPDHPVRAMPMMVEILTQKVKQLEKSEAELLLKLICYHDLVGEVVGKGRDKQQIVDVVRTELELDALFVLGKADATAVFTGWWLERPVATLYQSCKAAILARNARGVR